jgi:hypothetical protein
LSTDSVAPNLELFHCSQKAFSLGICDLLIRYGNLFVCKKYKDVKRLAIKTFILAVLSAMVSVSVF